MKLGSWKILVVLVVLVICTVGCTYLKNRGNDLADVFDVGITVTDKWKPDFRLYSSFFLFPVGYSHVDGKLIGWGNRHFGINDFEAKEYGLLLTGRESYGTGPLNPEDPRQVWPTYAKDDPNAPKERPKYKTGLIPLIKNDKPRLWTKYVECNKGIHLGWIGIHVPCRPLDLIDFVLGWTTLDIMGDDEAGS
jgi:hypothetical protein